MSYLLSQPLFFILDNKQSDNIYFTVIHFKIGGESNSKYRHQITVLEYNWNLQEVNEIQI